MVFNKYVFITIIFLILFSIISVLLKNEVESFAIYEANAKLDRVLTNQKALHTYVENELKPVIYKLKSEGKLYEEFFDPKVLSFTYIARSIYEIENATYKEDNKPGLYYKLAANNFRNDLNKASEFEKNLITIFNKNRDIKNYKDILEFDNEKVLYFSKPVTANKKSCLRCHSDPLLAPDELIQQYGDVKGFHEKLDDIRAILSIRISLGSELEYGNEYYKKLLVIVFLALLVVYIIIIYLLRSLDKKNKDLYKISTIDQLTQIYNRRTFDNDIHSAIAESTREQQSLVLIMIDIDFFKNINDEYGHQIGDEVLIQVAKIIKNITREYDRVYRIGGEEFIIILKNMGIEESLALAYRIKDEVQKYYSNDKNITLSLGVCKYNNIDNIAEFYKKVDGALYMAKENGRNLVHEYKEA